MRKSLSRTSNLYAVLVATTSILCTHPAAYGQVVRHATRGALATAPSAVPGEIVVKVPASYSDTDVQNLAASVNATITEEIPYSPHYYVFTLNSTSTTKAATVTAPNGKRRMASAPVQPEVLAAVKKLTSATDRATIISQPGICASANYILSALQTSTSLGPTLGVVANDPLYYPSEVSTTGQQWDMQMINMPQAWAIQSNTVGRTVVVAVLDTGLDETHPDLINQIAPGGMDFSPLDDVPAGTPTTTMTDPDGHGTNVSGIVAAQTDNALGVVGVAGWNRNNVSVKVLPVRVLGADGTGSFSTFVAGLNYAVAEKADVVNMSLGGGPYATPNDLTTDPFYAALVAAYSANVTVVVAAGNDSLNLTDYYFYPADYPNVITVSSVGPSKTLASYSDYGGPVAIAAPGGDDPTFSDVSNMILNCWGTSAAAISSLQGDGYPITSLVGYEGVQGTSQATPHVSGAIALLIAAGATETPANLKNIIQTTATVLNETPNFAGGNDYGAGLLNVYGALASLSSITPAFTAQLAEVVDNAVEVPVNSTNAAAGGSTGYSLVSSLPYTDQGLSYVKPQTPFTIRYLGRNSLIDSTGTDHPQYVTLDIAPATSPNAVLRHYVGAATNSTTTFALPALPSGSLPATVQTTTAPSLDVLNLPDGNYSATLNVYNSTTSTFVPQGIVFFEVASATIPAGLSMFSSPFTVDKTIVGSLPPELYEFGTSTAFTLERYNAQRVPTDTEYASYSPLPNATQSTQAEFLTPAAANGSPLTYLTGSPSTSIAPIGLGYFVSLPNAVTLNPTGETVNAAVGINLYADNGGWNMIGTPFTYPILWPSANILTSTGLSYSLDAAAAAGIISPAMVGYSDGDYVYNVEPEGTLEPFQAYWVRVYQDCTMIIPPTASTRAQVAARSQAAQNAAQTSQLPALNGWRAKMAVTVAGDKDSENYFGVVRSTNLSSQFYMVPKPPSSGGHAYFRFVDTNASGKTDSYALDVRKSVSATANQTWTAQVSSDKSRAQVTISWEGLGAAPTDTEFTLTDVATGKTVSMRSRSSYTFTSGDAGSTRVFQIAAAPGLSGGPLSISNFSVVGANRVTRSTAFQFTTNREAEVSAVVRALSGRIVATVASASTRAFAAQQTILHWNGRKDDGTPLPAGLYYVEVTLTTSDGQKATVKQPFTSLN